MVKAVDTHGDQAPDIMAGGCDRIRDIRASDWHRFLATTDPSRTIVNPFRRCGQLIKVPISPDVLRGGLYPPIMTAPEPRPVDERWPTSPPFFANRPGVRDEIYRRSVSETPRRGELHPCYLNAEPEIVPIQPAVNQGFRNRILESGTLSDISTRFGRGQSSIDPTAVNPGRQEARQAYEHPGIFVWGWKGNRNLRELLPIRTQSPCRPSIFAPHREVCQRRRL